MRKGAFSSLCLILVIGVIQSSYSHPDCDHKIILNNFLDMCKVYSPYANYKRETKGANGLNPKGPLMHSAQTGTQVSPYAHPTITEDDGKQYPSTGNPFIEWVSNSNNNLDTNHPNNDFDKPEVSNEPEDFASFNNWYLNPVYADDDSESPIERWRRTGHMKEEIWHFVHNICCVTGCPFPDAYMEFDNKANICGMR
ncbi:unnamed protein product [Orchesella dallaii]|uniref:Uncharacterized protein n=1 Tax=Orchesella dallaii TaxID=48710 RepID=A0ABP1QH07_9HEXA